MKTEFQVLKADHGDSILIQTFTAAGESFNILVDGGTSNSYKKTLKNKLQELSQINLLVLTHIDSDHIKGIIKFIQGPLFLNQEVKKYWFNSKNLPFLLSGENISYTQAISLEKLLLNSGELESKFADVPIFPADFNLAEGITARIISPTQECIDRLYNFWPDLLDEYNSDIEDVKISSSPVSQLEKGTLEALALLEIAPDKSIETDIINSSSIAFIIKMPDLTLLLLGDARPEIYIQGLVDLGYSTTNRLKANYVKVSHHGSINNTNLELANYVDSDNYIISTNGGMKGHCLPDRETIARIVHNPVRVAGGYSNLLTIFLNYPLSEVESRAGQFIKDEDFRTGNWRVKENQTIFPHEQ